MKCASSPYSRKQCCLILGFWFGWLGSITTAIRYPLSGSTWFRNSALSITQPFYVGWPLKVGDALRHRKALLLFDSFFQAGQASEDIQGVGATREAAFDEPVIDGGVSPAHPPRDVGAGELALVTDP